MNHESTIQELFSPENLAFNIPPYQRAYSWETAKDRKQVCQFIDDLREHPQTEDGLKSYYLGHFLFETNKNDGPDSKGAEIESGGHEYSVIDGQQRLTTVVIFFRCLCVELAARKQEGDLPLKADGSDVDLDAIQRTYVINTDLRRKLQTVHYDDTLLRNWILNGKFSSQIKTHSGRRLKDAMEYLAKRMQEEKSTAELVRWMELVENAVITTFEVRTKERATQIFAFQNDRGKDLGNLEKLKAFLMHVVYVHSPSSIETESIKEIERMFSHIYELSEEIKSLKEDQVLAHHLTAFLPWGDEKPVNVLKKALGKKDDGAARVEWIREFCGNLVQSFQSVRQIEVMKNGSTQHERLLGDVLHLNAGASWPLLLKLFHFHAHELAQVVEVLRLVEITLFKLQFMKGTSTNHLPDMARDYRDGELAALQVKLEKASQSGFQWWWDFNGGFRRFLEGHDQYHSRTRYLLWKYENHLRAGERGVHHLSLQEYLNETEGQNLDGSIEHIMPQNPEELVHSEDYKLKFLDNLGNLVLMTRGRNSSLKNKLPLEKATIHGLTPYLSQQVVVKTILDRGWGESEIAERKKEIVKFALYHWRAGEEILAEEAVL
jgi:hypothetical protein